MSQPHYPPGPPPQGYPQHGQPQPGYPQQGQPQPGYPQQGQPPPGYGQPGQPPPGAAPPKKGRLWLVLLLVLVPILGLGGWLAYQHLFNWGYVLAPAEVKASIEPFIPELQEAAEDAASMCRVLADEHKRGEASEAVRKATGNPLEDLKVIDDDRFKAAVVRCEGEEFGDSVPDLAPVEGVSTTFKVDIRDNDGFTCMAPNFLGLDSDERSDCVMWKGSGDDVRVRYEIGRRIEEGGATISVELKGTP